MNYKRMVVDTDGIWVQFRSLVDLEDVFQLLDSFRQVGTVCTSALQEWKSKTSDIRACLVSDSFMEGEQFPVESCSAALEQGFLSQNKIALSLSCDRNCIAFSEPAVASLCRIFDGLVSFYPLATDVGRIGVLIPAVSVTGIVDISQSKRLKYISNPRVAVEVPWIDPEAPLPPVLCLPDIGGGVIMCERSAANEIEDLGIENISFLELE